MKDLIKALEILGINGTVTTNEITHGRILILVDGEYFGIWDVVRKTFVD